MAKSGSRPAGRSAGNERPRSADTRGALIAAARAALRDVGFARASAREIAGRADCNQALIFYHFGSVTDLLLAALDDVSTQRLGAYRLLVERAGSLTELAESARAIFQEDLAAGHITVLVEMITAAQSVDGLGVQVAARLAPWRDFAEAAVGQALRGSPFASLLPAREIAHGVVAGFLGLELLANLDGDPAAALALFDRAQVLAALFDLTGQLGQLAPPGSPPAAQPDHCGPTTTTGSAP
ncbi:MAG TPA: TetR/AcrR family transcriptional regulator [Streptosporangiaceae bacterium]|jgi:AcrR family transcriptional regulator